MPVPSQPSPQSLIPYSLIALAWLAFAALSHYFFWQIGDDSYIYFRYVDRALAGQWWTWADYSGAVEGYSSPLWYLLLIGLGKLGIAVDIAARGLGILCAGLAMQGCWRLARTLGVSEQLAGVACLVLALNQGVHFWASSGLETPLYMALMVWSCLGLIRGRFWLLPTTLLAVARPEGPFLLIALCIAIAVFRKHLFTPKNLILLWLPFAAWLAVRLMVYQDVLPNTYYAKATGNKLQQIMMGLLYCLPVILPLLLAWLLWFKDKRPQSDALLVVLGMVSLLVGIVFAGGGDWMYFFRLLVPVYALLFAALAYYWQQSRRFSRTAILLSSALLLAISVTPQTLLAALQGKQLPVAHYQEGEMTQRSIEMARAIQQRYKGNLLVAVNHAGALPWALPDFDMIDMVGLNDKHIASVQGSLHQKFDVDYVLSLKPDLIVLNSRTKPGKDGQWYHAGYWQGETALVEHPDFAQQYQATDLVYPWQWQIPWPYALLLGKKEVESWILLYERKTPAQ